MASHSRALANVILKKNSSKKPSPKATVNSQTNKSEINKK